LGAEARKTKRWQTTKLNTPLQPMVLDFLWAAAPLLHFHKMGEITFLFVAALDFLPFSQRTLISCAYPPAPAAY